MKFCVLGSSSSGNSTLIMENGTSILVDAGLPVGYTSSKIREITSSDSLDAIFVSHEHSDHTRSLFPLAKRYSCPVYLSQPVYWYLGKRNDHEVRRLSDGVPVDVGDIRVTPFIVPHDAIDPFGFIVEGLEGSLGIVTDLGRVDDNICSRLRNMQGLVVESNYDPDMLVNGRYPNYLKKRILDGTGHLSNQQCSELLSEVVGPETLEIVLAHLSEENNDPLLAVETSMQVLEETAGTPNIHVSYPRHPTRVMELGGSRTG